MPRRQALGILAACALVLGGRLLRRLVLLGPQGRWRDDLWFEDLLAAREDGGEDAAAGGRPARPVLTAPLPLNHCSEDSLTLLPGIGPRLAARIAASRHADGPFRSPADLQRVKGIGPVLAGRLAPLVEFDSDSATASRPAGKSP